MTSAAQRDRARVQKNSPHHRLGYQVTWRAVPGWRAVIVSEDTGAAAESLGVVRQSDVDGLSDQASRGGLAARLSANQRILLAVILIAAVFPVLPPEAQMTRGWLQL